MVFKIPDKRSSKARISFDPSQLCLVGPWDLPASTNSTTYSTHAKWGFWKDLTIHQHFCEISSVKVTRQLSTISRTKNLSFHFCPETPTMGFPSKVSCFNLIKCQFTGSKQDTIKVSNFLDINIPMLSLNPGDSNFIKCQFTGSKHHTIQLFKLSPSHKHSNTLFINLYSFVKCIHWHGHDLKQIGSIYNVCLQLQWPIDHIRKH